VWDHASTLSSYSWNVQWESAGADRFRESVERNVTALHRTVDQLEEAAAILAAHAETVRERLAAIARTEYAARTWFDEQVRHLKRLASKALYTVADAVTPGPPPWHDWPWTPRTLPPPGDKQWLEVGELMVRKGVL
jgi:ABC-type nitrate/sulfonate/bicarbonate transport system substrate-binding protein